MDTFYNGQRVGNLVFISDEGFKIDPKYGKKRRIARFKCHCGNEFITAVSPVKRCITKSCGCINKQRVIEKNTKHGLCRHPLYGQWQDIKNRCNNPNIKTYYLYGGRGIKVCDDWSNDFMSFYKWAIANGWEWGLSIDRINNNENYCPNNCRIANNKEQARNRRTNIIVDYNNEKLCLAELCEKLNLKYNIIRTRISTYKWSIEKAITTETRSDKIKRLNGDWTKSQH